jgi:hypothetical protein
MLQLENRSPFAVAVAAFPDEQGIDTLVVAVKVTYKTYPRFVLADVQRPVELGDRYSGDPTRTGPSQPASSRCRSKAPTW